MYWEEKSSDKPHEIPDDIIDVVFGITCRALPVDHAFALASAIKNELQWIDAELGAGVHAIHVAASGNGWYRPEDASQLLYPSRRTKLTLRVPKSRIDDVKTLVGKSFDVDGNNLTVKDMSEKKLSDIATLFSRYIVSENGMDESAFLDDIVKTLNAMGIKPKKMLCGKEMRVAGGDDNILVTRSLMIADLGSTESILLQQQGLGSHRWMGCGIFLPHKDINEIGETMG